MKQEFMSAAKRIGKFLSVPVLAFMLAACGGEASASNASTAAAPTTVVMSQSVKKELPFPQFPASIEEVHYKGQKGCLADNDKTSLIIGAIMSNEGLESVGALSFMETPKDGAHSFRIIYNKEKDYSYIMANKAEGSLCLIDKLKNMSFRNTLSLQAARYTQQGEYSTEQCSFTKRYGNICGTFAQVSGALMKNGFAVDWQGERQNGDVLTLLSSDQKSYYLTTDDVSGATVVTGAGKYPFKYIQVPAKALLANNY
tara:strand:- start:20542 stop:21309 length:768 start_codon:yes stop_codon:yes gene_type:complete